MKSVGMPRCDAHISPQGCSRALEEFTANEVTL